MADLERALRGLGCTLRWPPPSHGGPASQQRATKRRYGSIFPVIHGTFFVLDAPSQLQPSESPPSETPITCGTDLEDAMRTSWMALPNGIRLRRQLRNARNGKRHLHPGPRGGNKNRHFELPRDRHRHQHPLHLDEGLHAGNNTHERKLSEPLSRHAKHSKQRRGRQQPRRQEMLRGGVELLLRNLVGNIPLRGQLRRPTSSDEQPRRRRQHASAVVPHPLPTEYPSPRQGRLSPLNKERMLRSGERPPEPRVRPKDSQPEQQLQHASEKAVS